MFKLPLAPALWLRRTALYAYNVGCATGLAGRTAAALLLFAGAGVLLLLPPALQTIAVCGGGLWFLTALVRALRTTPFISRETAEDALERDTKPLHRPLFARRDVPAFPLNAAQQQAWQQHLALAEQAARRRWRVLSPLRARGGAVLALLLSAAALLYTERHTAAANLTPQAAIPGITDSLQAEFWLEPPAYTGLPRQALDPRRAVSAPEGSTVYARVSGASFRPRLVVGKTSFSSDKSSDSYLSSAVLDATTTIRVRHGLQHIGPYRVQVTKDNPPAIALIEALPENPSGVLRVHYNGLDDYGIVRLTAVVERLDDPAAPLQRVTLFDWPVGGRIASGERPLDLTSTRAAGKPVRLTLEAFDAKGQKTVSNDLRLLMPQRFFKNPMAQKIALVRDSLMTGGVSFYAASRQLQRFSDAEAASFDRHWDALLSVRVAAVQLRHAEMKGSKAGDVLSLLWHAALVLDQNRLEKARGNLRDAAAALDSALRNPADAAALKAALKRYQQALAQYLQQLAQQGGQQQIPGAAQATAGDLTSLLQQLAASGDSAGAAALLQKLQALLERLQGGAPSAQARAAEAAAAELRALQQQQQQLEQRLKSGSASDEDIAAAQHALAARITALRQTLSAAGMTVPPGLVDAEQSAAKAGDALEEGDRMGGEMAQARTRRQLQAALDALQQQAAMLSLSSDGFAAALGMESIPVPENGTPNALRGLIEELRKRVNDGSRSERERRYLRELLEQN